MGTSARLASEERAGLPWRSEALRRAEAEEDRDEALWRSAPKARAADDMVPAERRRARQLFDELRRPGGAGARPRGWVEPDLMGIDGERLRFDACPALRQI